MRIREKLLFIIVPLILLPIILAGGITYLYSQSTKVTLENAKLHSDVIHGVNEVTHLTKNVSSATRYLSYNHLLMSALAEPSPEAIKAVESTFTEFAFAFKNTVSIKLISPQGDVFARYFKQGANPLAAQIESKMTMDWDLIFLPQQAVPLVEISWPIHQVLDDYYSAQLGTVQLVLELDLVNYLKLNAQQGDKMLITDMAGNVIFSFPQKQLGGQIPDYLFHRLQQSVNDKVAIDVELGGEDIYMTGQSLSNKYLFLFGQNRANYEQKDVSLIWLLPLVISISVLLAASLIIISVNKLIIIPISNLSGAKQEVAQGNLDVKLEVSTKDEIAELFSSFNVMVKQLEVYREKEKDSRLRLEYKVKERTEDLETANRDLELANAQLERAKQLSEQANQLKTAFVANMSHEIRTPLTAILGFTEQVIADTPRTPHQLDLMGRVLKSGNHLLSLINNILNLSKIESGRVELELSRFDMFELFNDVVTIMSNQAAEGLLEFDFNYHYPLPRQIRSDSTRLRQVLLNLASNAIKFTEKGSVKIDVRYLPSSQQVEVQVIDTGIGMSQDVLDYIFEPFTQADLSISRRFGGTGLGLVISRSFAQLLGGDITVESQLGKGSKFVFTFALSADDTEYDYSIAHSILDLVHSDEPEIRIAPPELPELVQGCQDACSGRVLVAEDVEDNQYLIKMLLDNLGAEHTVVGNGEQAVEKAMTEEFDLILMDMQMPIMGGLEATELLRAAGVETPIYALTANVMKEDMQQHLASGCNGTIAKPVDRNEFNRVVCGALNSKVEDESSALPEQMMQQLKQKYLSQLPEQVDILNKCLGSEDLSGLTSELHKIKGSAGSYGFGLLSTMAAELEGKCKQAEPEQIQWSEVKSELAILVQTISNIRHAESSKR